MSWGQLAAPGGGVGQAPRTVVRLGGDEDRRDEQAVDVVVRRAEGRPVLIAEPPQIGQSNKEADRVELSVTADAHEVAVDGHARPGH